MLSGTQKSVLLFGHGDPVSPFSQRIPTAGLDAWQAGLRRDLPLAGNIGFLAN